MADMTTYSATDFIQRLSSNDLPDNDALSIAGLVKPDDSGGDYISFAPSTSCERWLTLPADLIEDITHLRSMKCKDHHHPLVKIRLKQPDSARPEVAFLLGLLSEIQGTLARLSLAQRTDSPTTAAEGEEYSCYTVIAGGQVYVCCGPEPVCTGVV